VPSEDHSRDRPDFAGFSVKGDRPNRAARAAKKKTMNTDQNNIQTQSGLTNRPRQLSTDTNQWKEVSRMSRHLGRGDSISIYTRTLAFSGGFRVDVSDAAREAGYRVPVFLTGAVYDSCVTVPAGVDGQDEVGRLWDILWMMRDAIRHAPRGFSRFQFTVYVRNDNRKPRLVHLVAEIRARDFDGANPALTVMLPDED
jgi:hypothetical protein